MTGSLKMFALSLVFAVSRYLSYTDWYNYDLSRIWPGKERIVTYFSENAPCSQTFSLSENECNYKRQETVEDYIMRSVMMYVRHKTLLDSRENWTGARNMRGGEEQCPPKFGLKPETKRALWKPGWADNVRVNPKEIKMRIGYMWLRIRTSR